MNYSLSFGHHCILKIRILIEKLAYEHLSLTYLKSTLALPKHRTRQPTLNRVKKNQFCIYDIEK